MIKVLQNLEPRFIHSGEYIYKENEDVEEVYFVMKGEVKYYITLNMKNIVQNRLHK